MFAYIRGAVRNHSSNPAGRSDSAATLPDGVIGIEYSTLAVPTASATSAKSKATSRRPSWYGPSGSVGPSPAVPTAAAPPSADAPTPTPSQQSAAAAAAASSSSRPPAVPAGGAAPAPPSSMPHTLSAVAIPSPTISPISPNGLGSSQTSPADPVAGGALPSPSAAAPPSPAASAAPLSVIVPSGKKTAMSRLSISPSLSSLKTVWTRSEGPVPGSTGDAGMGQPPSSPALSPGSAVRVPSVGSAGVTSCDFDPTVSITAASSISSATTSATTTTGGPAKKRKSLFSRLRIRRQSPHKTRNRLNNNSGSSSGSSSIANPNSAGTSNSAGFSSLRSTVDSASRSKDADRPVSVPDSDDPRIIGPGVHDFSKPRHRTFQPSRQVDFDRPRPVVLQPRPTGHDDHTLSPAQSGNGPGPAANTGTGPGLASSTGPDVSTAPNLNLDSAGPPGPQNIPIRKKMVMPMPPIAGPGPPRHRTSDFGVIRGQSSVLADVSVDRGYIPIPSMIRHRAGFGPDLGRGDGRRASLPELALHPHRPPFGSIPETIPETETLEVPVDPAPTPPTGDGGSGRERPRSDAGPTTEPAPLSHSISKSSQFSFQLFTGSVQERILEERHRMKTAQEQGSDDDDDSFWREDDSDGFDGDEFDEEDVPLAGDDDPDVDENPVAAMALPEQSGATAPARSPAQLDGISRQPDQTDNLVDSEQEEQPASRSDDTCTGQIEDDAADDDLYFDDGLIGDFCSPDFDGGGTGSRDEPDRPFDESMLDSDNETIMADGNRAQRRKLTARYKPKSSMSEPHARDDDLAGAMIEAEQAGRFDWSTPDAADPSNPDDSFDEAVIAEANAEALANDDEGFYSREFGFYLRSPNAVEPVEGLGGFFGPAGLDAPPKWAVREPNLTPITERSEISARNSYVSPALRLHQADSDDAEPVDGEDDPQFGSPSPGSAIAAPVPGGAADSRMRHPLYQPSAGVAALESLAEAHEEDPGPESPSPLPVPARSALRIRVGDRIPAEAGSAVATPLSATSQQTPHSASSLAPPQHSHRPASLPSTPMDFADFVRTSPLVTSFPSSPLRLDRPPEPEGGVTIDADAAYVQQNHVHPGRLQLRIATNRAGEPTAAATVGNDTEATDRPTRPASFGAPVEARPEATLSHRPSVSTSAIPDWPVPAPTFATVLTSSPTSVGAPDGFAFDPASRARDGSSVYSTRAPTIPAGMLPGSPPPAYDILEELLPTDPDLDSSDLLTGQEITANCANRSPIPASLLPSLGHNSINRRARPAGPVVPEGFFGPDHPDSDDGLPGYDDGLDLDLDVQRARVAVEEERFRRAVREGYVPVQGGRTAPVTPIAPSPAPAFAAAAAVAADKEMAI